MRRFHRNMAKSAPARLTRCNRPWGASLSMPSLKCPWTKGERTATGTGARIMTAACMARLGTWPPASISDVPAGHWRRTPIWEGTFCSGSFSNLSGLARSVGSA
ncbi:hypothetical protein SPAR_29416 [Streptomyces sparsogenes DSM 40356]|uniref:Uncharacterized protein n=1 Tax=Streptomyces sparsogenes DSM 40356 TaxID=1331668 RepID=A0A1R1SBQ3_9ACTN|nr:hypothetical protein SPAR_29416 [Streptomyces sparsogenes DSM 40356]